MIITTKSAMRTPGRSKRGHIIAAVNYVMRDDPPGRVKDVWSSPNMGTTDRDTIKGLMLSVAEMSTRARNPVRHYVLTWRPEEEVSREEKAQIIDRLLRANGVEDHQWVAVEHQDKDGPHLHIVLSTINPISFKANSIHNETVNMMKELALINHERGWDRSSNIEYENARYRVDDRGEVVDIREERDIAMPKERTRAAERHGPDMAMESYLNLTIKENLYPTKESLKGVSWQDFHRSIAAHGLQYEPKNTGAVWKWTHADVEGKEVTETRKASVIPSFARGKLEKILGPYQSPSQDVKVDSGIHVASPTNPTMAAEAARDVGIVAKKAAQTRQQIRRRQVIKAQVAFLHSSTYTDQHLSGRIAETQRTISQAQKLKAQRQVIKRRLAFLNSPEYTDQHLLGGVAQTQKKIIQARKKLIQKRLEEEQRKARAELERLQIAARQRQEEEDRQVELERIRKEQEMESDNQKAPAAPSPTPAQAGVGSIDAQFDPPVQDQSNTPRAVDDHWQAEDDEPTDKFIFIESVKVGQVREAMEFAVDMLSWEECQLYIPQWWREATGEEIPSDWEALYGPEPDQELMQPELEPEEEDWTPSL